MPQTTKLDEKDIRSFLYRIFVDAGFLARSSQQRAT
jgi:hypothetical protein